MSNKEFDQCLTNLLVTAANGGQMTRNQMLGALELAKLNLYQMMLNQTATAAQKNIITPLPPRAG